MTAAAAIAYVITLTLTVRIVDFLIYAHYDMYQEVFALRADTLFDYLPVSSACRLKRKYLGNAGKICREWGKMLKEYYRLGRPINALAGVLAVFVSAYAAGPLSWWPVIAASLTVLLITVSTNAWNDYVDIEIDRINKPGRPLPSGKISPKGALAFSLIGTAISLLIATFINLPAFLIAIGANILLYLYSWKLKCTVLWGNITVALIIGLCFIFGGVAAGNIKPTLMLAVTVFLAMMGREILKTMADYRGDLEQQCRTISTGWGKASARRYTIVFLTLAKVMMLVTYFVEDYKPAYLYLVIFGLYPILTYIAIKAKSDADGHALENNSTLMKYSFFIWFLAVVLGAA